jgi:hypothetical protein
MKSFRTHLNELSKPAAIDTFKKSVAGIDKVDTRNTSWNKQLPDLMSKFGFKLLGSGKYASVFGNPKYEYVLKVFMKDSAYLKWIEFAQKNKDNPYVPKVRGKVIKITPMFYAIRLEKLTPYSQRPSLSPKTTGPSFMQDYYKWQDDKNHKSNDPNVQSILDYFQKHKALLDLHGENMMMRGSQLVIIDPFYNWFNKTKPMDYTIDPDDINPDIF